MASDFQTFGPFLLERKSGLLRPGALEACWQAAERTCPGLASAAGVYIVGVKRNGRSIKPWYVGKTERSFQQRFWEHERGSLFRTLSEQAPNGDAAVFLLARVSGKTGAFKHPKRAKLPSIKGLELLLIGSCFSENKRLINAQKMSLYRDLIVPGYINAKPGKPHGAAKELAAMFERKKG